MVLIIAMLQSRKFQMTTLSSAPCSSNSTKQCSMESTRQFNFLLLMHGQTIIHSLVATECKWAKTNFSQAFWTLIKSSHSQSKTYKLQHKPGLAIKVVQLELSLESIFLVTLLQHLLPTAQLLLAIPAKELLTLQPTTSILQVFTMKLNTLTLHILDLHQMVLLLNKPFALPITHTFAQLILRKFMLPTT